MDKTTIGLILGAVIIFTIILVVGSRSPVPVDQADLGEAIELQPASHIAPGEDHPAYNSNPPTSGWHYAVPAEWGIHSDVVADETAVHNLEHGGIWISYQPDRIDDATKTQLEGLVRGYRSKVLLTPRPANSSPIALASWGRLLKLDTYDEITITAFIDAYKNKGPEQIPD